MTVFVGILPRRRCGIPEYLEFCQIGISAENHIGVMIQGHRQSGYYDAAGMASAGQEADSLSLRFLAF